jgi:hypothetical protein
MTNKKIKKNTTTTIRTMTTTVTRRGSCAAALLLAMMYISFSTPTAPRMSILSLHTMTTDRKSTCSSTTVRLVADAFSVIHHHHHHSLLHHSVSSSTSRHSPTLTTPFLTTAVGSRATAPWKNPTTRHYHHHQPPRLRLGLRLQMSQDSMRLFPVVTSALLTLLPWTFYAPGDISPTFLWIWTIYGLFLIWTCLDMLVPWDIWGDLSLLKSSLSSERSETLTQRDLAADYPELRAVL